MKVFITGATGYVGEAAAEAIRGAGHEVRALAHRPGAGDEIRAKGWTPVAGDLRQAAVLESAAAAADAVVHVANTNDADAAEVDGAAVAAFLRALGGSDKPFVYTSGVWVLGDTGGREVDESASTAAAAALVAWRAEREREVLAAARRGVRPVVLRPGIVYGRGGGIPAMLVAGDLPLIGDGSQHWTTVHVDDLADLYLRALTAPAGGTVLHGIAGQVTMADLAGTAEAVRGEPVEPMTLEVARQRLGAFADALALDQRVSPRRTRELTGWSPGRPSILDEVRTGSYRPD